MAIMATDMVLKKIKKFGALCLMLSSASINAEEWLFTPSVEVKETYTDNINLEDNNKLEAFVNQAKLGFGTEFNSRLTAISLNASATRMTYSADSKLNDNYKAIDFLAKYYLWHEGLAINTSISINNQAQNNALNNVSDLISADTVETQSYATGLSYDVANSDYEISSEANYSINSAEDSIGESDGFDVQLSFQNGNAARNIFWQLRSFYSDRENNNLSGQQHSVDAVLGIITPYKINPFIRFFDEDNSGNFSSENSTQMSSWGPGIRWFLSSKLRIDTTYNFVKDKDVTDDYIATAINWQPSNKTSLIASYNKRFFGNSYGLSFNHKLKRLSNQIEYKESINSFDRGRFNQLLLGNFLCPINVNITDISDCVATNNQAIDINEYQLVALSRPELVESNEFSLSKDLTWHTVLELSRTSFSLSINGNERESLSTGVIDSTFETIFEINRVFSSKSHLAFKTTFQHLKFDKNNTLSLLQDDYYRQLSINYEKKIARTITTTYALAYLNRSSTRADLNYDETRIIFTLKKDF